MLWEQPRHLRCSSSVILPGGQTLPQEEVYTASLRPVQDFTVPTCQELILFVTPCPGNVGT